ncbi:MAG: hypothetical protein UV67_C0011G0028 [Parcubacteria group bacterium GW2011_GWC1_43_12]|nr:MAG: hypothetical protein UV34_C0020G0022 [Parcubacteria group bacterium GW2011_GWB1_42_6]KKS92072.1 MAG: hypothetical protein UV67_C0011G0028 [Parcubacteria group bacterium GW2011_GWC1_43_12]
MEQATELVSDWLKKDRPFASEKYIGNNSHKIAQEQMRVFIPTIFPTALDYTVDLITLATMYRTAWTPAMKFAVSEMARLILEKYPGINFMFEASEASQNDWGAGFLRKQ